MSDNPKYAVSEKKPSKMFLRSLNGGGSSEMYCNCGRQHYAPGNLRNSEDPEDYERMLASCEEEKAKDPEGVVINYEDDFISGRDIDGRTFVDDCPCNGLRKYEDWIWENRNVIREYYKIRVDQELKWAEQEKSINVLTGISK